MLYYVEVPKDALVLEKYDEQLNQMFDGSPLEWHFIAGETFVKRDYYVMLLSLNVRVPLKEMRLRLRNLFGVIGRCDGCCTGLYDIIDQSKPIAGDYRILPPSWESVQVEPVKVEPVEADPVEAEVLTQPQEVTEL